VFFTRVPNDEVAKEMFLQPNARAFLEKVIRPYQQKLFLLQTNT